MGTGILVGVGSEGFLGGNGYFGTCPCPGNCPKPKDCCDPSVGVPVKALNTSSRATQQSLKSFIVKGPSSD